MIRDPDIDRIPIDQWLQVSKYRVAAVSDLVHGCMSHDNLLDFGCLIQSCFLHLAIILGAIVVTVCVTLVLPDPKQAISNRLHNFL